LKRFRKLFGNSCHICVLFKFLVLPHDIGKVLLRL